MIANMQRVQVHFLLRQDPKKTLRKCQPFQTSSDIDAKIIGFITHAYWLISVDLYSEMKGYRT